MKATVALILALSVYGCATTVKFTTYGAEPNENILKHSSIVHSWWLGLPALAPMDANVMDGEFSMSSKSIDLGGVVKGVSK